MDFLAAIILLLQLTRATWAIQTNNTCVPTPKDKRQIICQCSKQLQLRCLFNMDMLIMDTKYLDASIRPIYYDDVSLDRAGDPQDSGDINNDFKLNKKKFANNRSNMYLYFPNFKLLSQPYIRITLSKFHYIPSFAFTNNNDDKKDAPVRRIESVIFELPNIYDFGVDEFAFHNVQVTDTLLIEGPFNQINFHANAFKNALINELIIGCYCVECEYFEADCKLNLNQASLSSGKYKKSTGRDSAKAEIKSIKLFGVDFSLNLDELPGVDSLEKLEITNIKTASAKSGADRNSELRSSRTFPKMKQLNYRNNNLKNLNKLNAFYLFPNLTVASFSQNKLDKLDRDTFKYRTLRNLVELYLERNELTRLDATIFNSNLANLKVLNLNTNKIEQVTDATFEQLSSLEVLDLSHNRIAYLNEKTLYGLSSLKKLHLSYNPFKSFDADSFKYVAASLNRLDLISNSDADWFTFDDNDVCLLSYFKCNTQIFIDTDQRCNCFIKYLNLITAGADLSDSSLSSDDMAVAAFKPCQLNSVSNSLNRYFDDLNSLYEASNNHKGLKVPVETANDVDVAKSTCDRKALEKCFANRNANASANSCLYSNLINPSVKSTSKHSTTSTWAPAEQLNGQESQKEDERNVSSTSSYLHQMKDGSDKTGVDNDGQPKIQKAKSLLWNKYSLEESLTVVLVGIAFIFIVSMISLFIGVYLIMKRNTFVYHATDSSYPQDEK